MDVLKKQAFVHTGMFVGWVIDAGLYSEEFAEDFEEEIRKFKARKLTGAGVYRLGDGVFDDDMLSKEARHSRGHILTSRKENTLRTTSRYSPVACRRSTMCKIRGRTTTDSSYKSTKDSRLGARSAAPNRPIQWRLSRRRSVLLA